jgi:anti-sigma regulatory factor (Ser/Thr protein kinase)
MADRASTISGHVSEGAFLSEIADIMSAATEELKAHANDGGFCAACGSVFPCERATLAEFALGAVVPDSPDLSLANYCWTFPGTADQIHAARQLMAAALDRCPAADEVILCLSELTTNAVQHSASARPDGTFTVHAKIASGAGVYLEVVDDGGPWLVSGNDGRMHGLGIVRSLAASMSISGDEATGWVVTAWFGWNPVVGTGHRTP